MDESAEPVHHPRVARHRGVTPGFVAELRAAVASGSQVSENPAVRRHHAGGFDDDDAIQPDVVVFAERTEEVARVLAACNRHEVPVVAFGAGTSVAGQVVCVRGGVCLSLARMDDVLAIDPANLLARVQPGVTRRRLNAAAGEHGLFLPVDPGADASIGGMTATNASGTTTVRYGSMRHQVLSLEVVLADGKVVRTGTLARKSSAGYDLTSLFVGSEGTLGIITEVALRLHGIPEHTAVVRVQFPDVVSASRCAAGCMAAGLGVSRMELMDAPTVAMLNDYAGRDDPVTPCLLIEVEGSRVAVEQEIMAATELAAGEGGVALETESDPTRRAKLWRARHDAAHAFKAQSRGRPVRATDLCVPIAHMPDGVALAEELLTRYGFQGGVAGHVGDGSYHVVFTYDGGPDLEHADAIVDELAKHALAVGGTCSGEHGIGLAKKGLLRTQHGDVLPLMGSIKQGFDPLGILNPEKIFDAP